MQVFIILAIVSLVVVFSVMKLLQYRKENSEDGAKGKENNW